MKISYNWLQNYFPEKLPAPEKLADILTFHVFEIEGIEKAGEDTVLDVKVLPDRAHYALSHRGVAYEVAAITGLAKKAADLDPSGSNTSPQGSSGQAKKVIVNNLEPKDCLRYIARYIEGVEVKQSPDWLKEKLEAVGQRAINNIVDATNYVMLDMNQPLHAFDADKVIGAITIRKAKAGEKIIILDGKEIALDPSILVIADDESPLAIAGVKGGAKAAVSEKTKNIILESANFNASSIRKTSQKVGIRNDSSKRFENDITPEFAPMAMNEVTKLIVDAASPKGIGEITDDYPDSQKIRSIHITSEFITSILGAEIQVSEIEAIFTRLHINFTKNSSTEEYTLIIPSFRLDLMIPEDIVEEVGRIYGYDKIPATLLPKTTFKPVVNKEFYYANKVKDILVETGYSEVYTYSLKEKGDIEIENPLASDKNFLRNNLSESIEEALEFNLRNADLLGLDQIKIFEIGTVFTKKDEYTSLAIGILNVKGRKGIKKETEEGMIVIQKLSDALQIKGIENMGKLTKNVFELNLSEFIKNLPDVKEYDVAEKNNTGLENKTSGFTYKHISPYPFSVRDIAVFVPENITELDLRKIIEEKAGKLLVRNTLFDVFKKKLEDGAEKTSYAFRLVLQSDFKTLTEEEITGIMKNITDTMNGNDGWQVR